MTSPRSLAHPAAQLRNMPPRNRYVPPVLETHDGGAVELGTNLHGPGEIYEVLTMHAQEALPGEAPLHVRQRRAEEVASAIRVHADIVAVGADVENRATRQQARAACAQIVDGDDVAPIG